MNNLNAPLTPTNIRYLLEIYSLWCNNECVQSVSIARNLNVSKPSVHRMVSYLSSQELIKKELYGHIHLTDKGLCLAKQYNHYYTLIYNQLNKVLCLEKSTYEKIIYNILSETDLDSLNTHAISSSNCH